jgi:ParB-like chromosome segregation protein Spo0J
MISQGLDTQIEMWPIGRFIPYERNPRKNDAAVDRMAAFIQEFGFNIPVLARSNGEVVDGHLRLKAAKKLSITEVPVILCDEWTEAQVKAFRLIVNRSVGWAERDEDALALALLELKDLDFDLVS